MDLNFDGAVLYQLFKTCFQRGFYKVILTTQACIQTVVDAFEVGGDLHVQRRAQAGELQIINNADGPRTLLIGLLQDDCAFLAQGQAESRLFVSLKRGRGGAQDFFDGIECPGVRCGRRRSPRTFKIERHAFHGSRIKGDQAQHRVARGYPGQTRLDAAFGGSIQLQAGGKHDEAAALGATFNRRRLVLDESKN